ncbi:MAG: 3-oxoacyl-[acyl-carrier-protein] synthase [Solirubrobacteraceae bacterium]|nr:3-oxoacyl-[acyl-carrier-protein] synthase [Solirubrobacteraceae bacterium]
MSSLAETTPAGARARIQPTRNAGIAGLGAALPAETVANAAIAARLELGPEWIERRTGIRNRRRAAPDERVVDLAAQAGRAALADAGLDAGAIDTVLVATMSADELTPNTAPQVAHALGAERAGAMDIGAACTGFVAGLTVAAGLVEAGRAENVLMIGAEILSRLLDYDDRSTAGLFGDGAGAVVVTASAAGSVGTSVLGSDGSAAAYIRAPHDTGLISMDGHETFKRAVTTLASNALEALDANGLTRDDIELFVFHQANGRITSAVADAIAVDPSRVVDAIGEMGNTSAASIPLALSEAHREGRLGAGDRVLLGAVGAGFTWGATVVTWGAA